MIFFKYENFNCSPDPISYSETTNLAFSPNYLKTNIRLCLTKKMDRTNQNCRTCDWSKNV